ncbi:interferon-inducible GTPase 5-like [Mercenaria mercenaria]|uniref:interferon-inducible GTPase 5-like n=1 Tax=Mercenaria mercenaria TaxID=6596 RepID=UPI00234F3409|nr:interferon-inducible GTPase 5-like [Mercenaria mercenaria]
MANRFDCPAPPSRKYYDIAVVGRGGTGKSSFINAVRSLSTDDYRAATVGSLDKLPNHYPYFDPRDENLRFWELPSIRKMDSQTIREIFFDMYDLVLILTATRLTEEDVWLANEVTRAAKPVYIIKSKIDVDIRNERRYRPRTHDQVNLIQRIRQEYIKSLESINLHIPVFLIDSFGTDEYDFPELAEKLHRKETIVTKACTYNKEEKGVTDDEGVVTKAAPRVLEGPKETAKDIYSRIAVEIKSKFDEKGMAGIKEHILENLDKWKNVEVNIVITGESGSGKSSFINAIRNLTADDEGAAAVGCVETTMKAKSYEHPTNKNFKLWDLPGVGTLKFKREDYLRQIDFSKFEFVIIMSCDRFTQNDAWLAKEMKRMQKKYFFVRTKAHTDVKNNKKSHPRSHDKAVVLAGIRENCHRHLKENGLPPLRVFLIDNMKTNEYSDFERLELCLIAECTDQQRDMITFTLSNATKEVNLVKKRRLEARIPFIALIFGFKFIVSDLRRLLHDEMTFYKSQFSLNPSSLKHDAQVSNVSDHTVEKILLQADKDSDTISQVEKEMNSLARFIPIVAQFKVSKACARYLRDCLDSISDVAIKANDEMVRNMNAVKI